MHPELCWFSNYSDRFVSIGIVPLSHRILDLPYVGKKVRQGFTSRSDFPIKPSEAGHIYHDYCGFEYKRKTTEDDLDIEKEKRFKGQIAKHLAYTGKRRFLSKQTANIQRIRLIDKMFDDAYYIHILRDGRAVANSLLNVSWWKDTDIWWLGIKASHWEKDGKPAIKLCGLHWQRDVMELIDNKYLFEDRLIEIRYEDFIADVRGTMDKVIGFCELSQSKSFLETLPKTLPNMNQKWQEQLTAEQKDILQRTIEPALIQLGYE